MTTINISTTGQLKFKTNKQRDPEQARLAELFNNVMTSDTALKQYRKERNKHFGRDRFGRDKINGNIDDNDDNNDGDDDKDKMTTTERKHRLKLSTEEKSMMQSISNNLCMINANSLSKNKKKYADENKKMMSDIADAMDKFFRILFIFELMKCMDFPDKTYNTNECDMDMVRKEFERHYNSIWEEIDDLIKKRAPDTDVVIFKRDFTHYA
jgi:hypothetical protein